jgi:hypothetical protein
LQTFGLGNRRKGNKIIDDDIGLLFYLFFNWSVGNGAIIFQTLGTMFGAVQPKTPDAVLAALVQHGAAIGPK